MFKMQPIYRLLHSVQLAFMALSLFAVATQVQASPIELIDGPVDPDSGVRHSVFHTASGKTLGWTALDASLSNFYDPDSGKIQLNYIIYDSSNLDNAIGMATGTGSLTGSQFNAFSGSSIGSIDWKISLNSTGKFLDYMQAINETSHDSIFQLTMSFLDIDYQTAGLGFVANSWQGGVMAIWNPYEYNTLGVDILVQTVPLPPAVWLFASGIIGLIELARRRQNI